MFFLYSINYLDLSSDHGDSKGDTYSSICCEFGLLFVLFEPKISKELGLVKLSPNISTESEVGFKPEIKKFLDKGHTECSLMSVKLFA